MYQKSSESLDGHIFIVFITLHHQNLFLSKHEGYSSLLQIHIDARELELAPLIISWHSNLEISNSQQSIQRKSLRLQNLNPPLSNHHSIRECSRRFFRHGFLTIVLDGKVPPCQGKSPINL